MAPSGVLQISLLFCILPSLALDPSFSRNPFFPGVGRPGRAGFRLPDLQPHLPNTAPTGHLPVRQPFPLSDVQLAPDSDFALNQNLNLEYLLSLDVDSLLYTYRVTAGLEAPGEPYGGWEGPDVEIRGQFTGHYLSALAFAYKNTGDEAFKKRGDEVVADLAACQSAMGSGYLSAFPSSHFDRLETLQPVWAPYYVIHKILQGLLDQHRLVGQPDALRVLRGSAAYHCDRSRAVYESQGPDHWHQVLDTEFGGMEDTLYALFTETGETRWAACAALFVKPNWFNPLAVGTDVLAGRHANTHLAQVLGFAARFEATGHMPSAAAVANFFTSITANHSFSTGGSNWWEGWGNPASLGTAINEDPRAAANTQESCTTYNIIKIARTLFRWTGRPEFADFYERALLNGVLGVQRHGHEGHHSDHNHGPEEHLLRPSAADREAIAATNAAHAAHPRPANHRTVSWPDDPIHAHRDSKQDKSATAAGDDPSAPGQFIYYMPLGAGASKLDNPQAWTQGFGSPFNSFWCCYGTAIESFSKLADSIYFYFSHAPQASPTESNTFSLLRSLRQAWPLRLGASLHAEAPAPAHRPPALFVNQLVSSTLRWRDLGVTLVQTADLYGDGGNSTKHNVAATTIEIKVEPPPSSPLEAAAGGVTQPSSARFFMHFRMPSWVNHTSPSRTSSGGLELTLNGRQLDLSTLPRSGDTGSDSEAFGAPPALSTLQDLSFNPPSFGKGADYVILGPEWTDEDVLEARLPMTVTVEDLNDARPEMQALKAVTMGPFVMAGITEGDRELDLAPKDVPAALQPVTDGDTSPMLVSLAPGADSRGSSGNKTSPATLLQHVRAWKMAFGAAGVVQRSRPAAMAATFRAVPVTPQELENSCIKEHEVHSTSQARLFKLESMAWPGRQLSTAPSSGGFMLRPPVGADSAQPLIFHIPSLISEDGGVGAPVVAVGLCGGGGRRALPALRLAAPAAERYPKGARILAGKTKKYLVAPLGQLIDEHYTPYFEFTGAAPSVAAVM